MDKVKASFTNPKLLDQALTHRSWINEHPDSPGTNERLEFLGDAVLEFVVSSAIYEKFPDQEEGYLTALRANLVNTHNLAEVAKELKVGEHIHLSKGEEETGGRENPSLLADTVEAVVGALYLDQGIAKAEEFITDHILSNIKQKLAQPLKDAKSRLQEKVQAEGLPTPKYKVIEESGPDHAKEFMVEVSIDGQVWGQGKGRNKAEAQQEAAASALKR